MKPPSLFFTAIRPFQAARRLSALDPSRALHGHGFEARALAPPTACQAAFPGEEATALGSIMEQAVAGLDYRLLNDRIETPDDAGIAEWLLAESGLAGHAGMSLQSAPDRGAVVSNDGPPVAWRRFRFEAAHYLPNVPDGHKCGRMHGHGFEVSLFATIEPGADAWATQEMIGRAWRGLHERLHLSCLNDLPGLDNPTSEVLAQWIWQGLLEPMPGLVGVTVMETASAGCHFDGVRWRIWKSMTFDSAVRLVKAPAGDRRRLVHGHTFTTRLHLCGGIDELLGWVHDYGDVKHCFDPVFRALDHQPLHEQAGLADCDPASIAAYIEGEMAAGLPGLSRIDVMNTPGCGALLCRHAGERELLVP